MTVVARWRAWDGSAAEHLVLDGDEDGVVAESVVIGTSEDGVAYALRYRVRCDTAWHFRHVDLALVGGGGLVLDRDDTGRWRDGQGRVRDDLGAALDIDIAASPFTNTLPIRRLNLPLGGSVDLTMAYIRVPELTVTTDPQRYTCLEPGRRYRYDSRDSDFSREILVDDHGLVVTYPGLFHRVL